MKKLLCVILCLGMLLALCSCGMIKDRLQAFKEGASEKENQNEMEDEFQGGISIYPMGTSEGNMSVIIGGTVRPGTNVSVDRGECEHQWQKATCTDPSYCSLCGEQSGDPLGCTFEGLEATCTTGHTCERCGNRMEALGHYFSEADCVNDGVCMRCGKKGERALGHTGGVISCQDHPICERCGMRYGEKLEHEFTELTCEQDSVCRMCGMLNRPSSGHYFREDGRCGYCGAMDPSFSPQTPSDNVVVTPFTDAYPLSIPGGSVQALEFRVQGSDILVTATLKKTASSGELRFGWRLYGSGYKELQNGSESTGYMSAGSTVEYTFTISNAVVSAHKTYKVHVGFDQYA